MGKPAARVGDPVAHIAPPVLGPGPGSTDVFIGGKPAWRGIPLAAAAGLPPPKEEAPPPDEEAPPPTEAEAEAAAEKSDAAAEEIASMSGGADIHACTQPSPVPFCVDGPGVVITGSATVLINGFPACRQGDMILEILGPPNSIVEGCSSVEIGG